MKTNYLTKKLAFRILSILLISFSVHAQVGIGTTTPTETLDVEGNVKFSGALMPNNTPGTAGQVLISDGANNPNTWGADLTNVSSIERYVTSPPGIDINAGTNTSITLTVPGLSSFATVIINIQGNWSSAIFDDITIHNIEVRTGEIRFSITNNTGKVEAGDMSAATFVDTTGGASLTGSFAIINLDTTLLNNDPLTFSLASDIVTETGFYSVNYTVTAKRNAGSGGNRGSLDARVSFNDGSGWAPIVGSSSEQYWRHNGGNGSTATKQFNYYFEAGDRVRLRAKESTNGVATVAGSSSLSFTLLRGGPVTTGVNYPGMIFNVTVIR